MYTKKDVTDELIDIYGISSVLKVNAPAEKPATQTRESTQNPEHCRCSTWEDLEKQLENCNRCRLAKTRTNIVFGDGNRTAELMFIGEGPGHNEDKTGKPFVGAAGQLLTKMIEAMNYTRDDVYIANVVKCRPPENRDPMKDEVEMCINFLHTQIKLIKPKVIVCLGLVAAKHLLKLDLKGYSVRGKWLDYNGIKVMPTYHPAYLLRTPSRKKDVWMDLQEVMKYLGKL